MKDMKNYGDQIFEGIKHKNNDGIEYWFARELQEVLEYKDWRNFTNIVNKAKEACESSGNSEINHFVDVNKTIEMPKSATREIDDIMLSRYACYLIVMNGDPRKKIIAVGQTYFAVKTRQQELMDNYDQLDENQKRIQIRSEMVKFNISLSDSANQSGVETPYEFAIFHNKGYQGLYGGLGAQQIKDRKGLKKSHNILDHMGSTELAANLFRATQTDEKLRRDNIQGKENAYQTHYEVGKTVRTTIQELGGTMPEDLPTPTKSIKQIEKEKNKLIEDNE